VDNSSSDGTEEMMQRLKAGSPCRLEYFLKDNDGPGMSRNFGVKKAHGDIIAFTDSDCVADAFWIEKGVSKMTEGIGLVQGKTLPNPMQKRRTFEHTKLIAEENGTYETCNIFYRKESLSRVGGFTQEFSGLDKFGNPKLGCEDIDLGWRVKKSGWKSVFAYDAIVYHHVFNINPFRQIFCYRGVHIFTYAIPAVIKKHPELRKILFYRLFVTKERALFFLFLMSVVLGQSIQPLFYFLSLPYITMLLKNDFSQRKIKTLHRGFCVSVIKTFLSFVIFTFLVAGSIRCRSIVL
jgi:GT2 family glycosyltransferase